MVLEARRPPSGLADLVAGGDFPHRWPHISTGWKGADSSLNFLLQRHQSHPCLLHGSSLLPVQAFISQRHVVLSPVWGFRWLRMDPEGHKYSDGRISVWLRFSAFFSFLLQAFLHCQPFSLPCSSYQREPPLVWVLIWGNLEDALGTLTKENHCFRISGPGQGPLTEHLI